MAYQDGNFTNAIQDGPARVFYPFINAPTKDTTTKGTVRNYVSNILAKLDVKDRTQAAVLALRSGLGKH